jgi:hypothetical protein
MDKRTKGCLLIGLGVSVLLIFIVVGVVGGVGYWMYTQFAFNATKVEPEDAASQMDRIRSRFGGQRPLLVTEGEGDDIEVHFDLEGRSPDHTTPLETLHIVAFDPDDGQLLRMSVPFWLIRLNPGGKISIGDDVMQGFPAGEKVTIQQLEAAGPGLVMDRRQADGSRVIIWSE